MGKSLHRFPSLGLKSRIDARKQPIPQHAFHHALTTSLALEVLYAAGSTQVRQWRQKRVLMRPEAAFPYVFAAEGAQHPPKKPPRSTTRRHEPNRSCPALRRNSPQYHFFTTFARVFKNSFLCGLVWHFSQLCSSDSTTSRKRPPSRTMPSFPYSF